MRSTGIRDLKNNLSRHLRRLRPGQVLRVTDRGRVVAEIRATAPETAGTSSMLRSGLTGGYERLLASGAIRPGMPGDPLADWPSGREVRLPAGTAAAFIGEDRGG